MKQLSMLNWLFYFYFVIDTYRWCFNIIASKLDQSSIFRFGINLNLPDKDVKEILSNLNVNGYDKTYEILTNWRQQSGLRADLNEIITVLKDMNKNVIAEKLIQKLHS